MQEAFNKLTPAEAERLALLAEECGEVVQAVGKILRHGYESNWNGGPTNRESLERECGDVQYAMALLCDRDDISQEQIQFNLESKAETVRDFLHHQNFKKGKEKTSFNSGDLLATGNPGGCGVMVPRG